MAIIMKKTIIYVKSVIYNVKDAMDQKTEIVKSAINHYISMIINV